MKRTFLLSIFLLVAFLLLNGCGSAKKSLKKGNYHDSVLRSAEKLMDNANHTSSADILKQAYPAALAQHLDEAERASSSSDIFRHEDELKAYESLNQLYRVLSKCNACMKITNAKSFETQETNARNSAANARYEEANELLAKADRQNARKAYDHFERANNLIPGYKEVDKKLKHAYHIASFKVVVEQVLVTSKRYQLSNEYFQNKVDEFLKTNQKLNRFVRFYNPEEATQAGLQPDHVITLQFDDFVVGQTLIEKNTETVTSKDSVKVGEKVIGKAKIPIYNRVTAKFTTNRKTVHSAGLLDMQIKDFKTRNIVNKDKFTGEYNWMCEWAHFNGDERALNPAQLRMCKSQELLPPDPQQLFIEFSKPIYDRLTTKLRNFYEKY
jgi:hypothetical protein